MDSALAFGDLTISADGSAKPLLPKAKDFTHHLTLTAKSRQANSLKELYKYASQPGMIALGGGLPPPNLFPYESISAEIQPFNAYATVPPTAAANATSAKASSSSGGLFSWLFPKAKKTDSITVPKYTPDGKPDPMKVTLSTLLQYSGAQGHPALQKFIKEFVARVYQPGYEDWACQMHVGATSGWDKVVGLLLERDQPVLVEEWTYPGAQNVIRPLNCPQIAVKIDGDGMIPSDLRRVLSTWDPAQHNGAKRPHLMYLVPVGQNPTGTVLPSSRKKEIYDICCEFDVIICEDDPYFFLFCDPWVPQNGKRSAEVANAVNMKDDKKGMDKFLKALPESFLKFDREGRVIRLETFSKTIAPGSRLGFFVANEMFCERLLRATESSTQAPCGFGQALVTQMLIEWGFDGWIRWLRGIKATYAMRRDWMCDAFEKTFHLEFDQSMSFVDGAKGVTAYARTQPGSAMTVYDEKRGRKAVSLFSFVPPSAGMFVWANIHIQNHPDLPAMIAKGEEHPEDTLMQKLWIELAEHNVLVSPGSFFDGTPGVEHATSKGSRFFRISFSIATQEDIETAVTVMYEVMTKFFRLK